MESEFPGPSGDHSYAAPPEHQRHEAKSRKRKRVYTSKKKQHVERSLPTSSSTSQASNIKRSIRYIQNSQYVSGFRLLCRTSSAAKQAFLKVTEEMAAQEIRLKKKSSSPSVFEGEATVAKLDGFSWDRAVGEVRTDCPTVASVLTGAIRKTNKNNNESNKVIGMICSMILCVSNIRRFKLVSQLNTIMMWLSGCDRKLYRRFSAAGFCTGEDTARKVADRLCVTYDEKVREHKKKVESSLHKLNGMTDASQKLERGEECELHNFSLHYDNVNKSISRHYQRHDKKNQQHNMVHCYATRLLVPTLHLDDKDPGVDGIMSVELDRILLNETEINLIKEEMCVIVTRMIVTTWPGLKDLQGYACWHIPHEHEREMAQKSEVTPLGVLDKDESVIGDLIDALKTYSQYTPEKPDGSPLKSVLWCDAKSCLGVQSAKDNLINGEDEWLRLGHFIPQAQQWHNRLHMAMDFTDEFLDGTSVRETGTLAEIVNFLNRTNVTKDTKHCFGPTYDLIVTTTTALVLLLGLHILEMKNITEDIPTFPKKAKEKIQFINDLASKIVNSIWREPNIEEIKNSSEFEKKRYCVCGSTTEEGTMVGCSNMSGCPNGEWFHIDCLGIEEDDLPEDDWFCCEGCCLQHHQKAQKKSGKTGPVINGVQHQLAPSRDMVTDYSKGMLLKGLFQVAMRDAIREGDGRRMLVHWKYQLLHFFQAGRPHYFGLALRHIIMAQGGASERIRQELLYGAVINLEGQKGACLEGDWYIELLNKFFKSNCNASKGNLTPQSIQRHSQLIGIKKKVDSLYEENVAERQSDKHLRSRRADDAEDVLSLVKHLQSEGLFQFKRGRFHNSFPAYLPICGVTQPKRLKTRILRHRELMVKEKLLIPRR